MVIRGDGTDTSDGRETAGSGGLAVFGGENVEFVVVPGVSGVSVEGSGDVMTVLESRYVVSIVTIETPGI